MNRALITGASDGLGYEIAKILVSKKWEAVSLSRTAPRDNLIKHISTDLTIPESIDSSVLVIRQLYCDFNVIINCAGIINVRKLGEIDYSESIELMKTNLVGPMYLISSVIDLIKKNEADIINVGSTIGYKAYPDQIAYGASKWGIRGLNENLRMEFKDTKSRVIGFMPGGFKSKLFEKYTGESIDISRYMDPGDLAKFLVQIIELPKTMEISEVIINRKL